MKMVIFDSIHAETSLRKLGTKSKKKRFMLIPNIGHNNKNETNGKSEPMPFLCKHTHTHTNQHTLKCSSERRPMENLRLLIRNSIFLVEHNGTHRNSLFSIVFYCSIWMFARHIMMLSLFLQTMSLIPNNNGSRCWTAHAVFKSSCERDTSMFPPARFFFPILSHHLQSNRQFAAGNNQTSQYQQLALHTNDIC